jgi:ribonuclease HI
MVNVDAAFNEDEGCGSVGAIIRDCSEGALAAAHSFVPHLIDAPMAEAYALKEGLMLAQHIGCNRLIVQSDCMEVVQTMNNGGFSSRRLRQLHCVMNVILYGANFRIYPLSIAVGR